MVGTSVPVPGILSHDISFHTHLPGLSIVLGFNLQHRMGLKPWDDGARKGVCDMSWEHERIGMATSTAVQAAAGSAIGKGPGPQQYEPRPGPP